MSSPGIFLLGQLASIMRTIRGVRLVGHKPLSEMKLGKPRGKSSGSPVAKRKPRRSGASRATWKPSPRNGARGRLDLRRSRERGLYKIDHFSEKPSLGSLRSRTSSVVKFNGVFWFQVKAGIDLLIG
jgi:hypothetical protein